MRVRKAKPTDSKQISKLHYKLYTGLADKKPIPLRRARLKNIVIVAEEEGQLIGYIWGNFVQYGLERIGYIHELYVNKKYRNEGLGTKLMNSMMKNLKTLRADYFFLTAEKGNRKALKFYKKLGFHKDMDNWLYRSPRYLKKKA